MTQNKIAFLNLDKTPNKLRNFLNYHPATILFHMIISILIIILKIISNLRELKEHYNPSSNITHPIFQLGHYSLYLIALHATKKECYEQLNRNALRVFTLGESK
jgi:hypothetical protein